VLVCEGQCDFEFLCISIPKRHHIVVKFVSSVEDLGNAQLYAIQVLKNIFSAKIFWASLNSFYRYGRLCCTKSGDQRNVRRT